MANSPFSSSNGAKTPYRQLVGTNRRRLLECTAVVWMFFLLVVITGRVVFWGGYRIAPMAAAGLAVSAGVLLASRQGYNGRWLASVLLLSIAAPIFALSYHFGGIHSPFLILLLFVPVAAFMLVSRPAGWVSTLVVCCYFVYLGVAGIIGNPLPGVGLTHNEETLARVGSFVVAMCGISALGWYYSRLYDGFYFSLKKSAEDLRLVAEYRSQFLISMSHEFRTPLNAIIGFSRRLQRKLSDRLSDTEKKSLDAVVRNGELMQVLVEGILNITKLEAGEALLELQQVNVADLVRQSMENFTCLAEQKPVQLIFDVDPSCEALSAFTDKGKLVGVLNNVLSNAVKFTDQGEVRVHLLYCKSDAGNYQIDISDTGIGIAEEELPTLFNRFSRAASVQRSAIAGLGLGLALAKEYLVLLQGSIDVRSRLGKGSCFSVVLPINTDQKQ